MGRYFSVILSMYKLLVKRYFRSRLAIFFSVVFPLIFLFVFGSLYGKNGDASFKVAVINHSSSPFAKQFTDNIGKMKVLKVQSGITSIDQARQKMNRSEIDSIIELPSNFGQPNQQGLPSGTIAVYYDQNSAQAGQTVASILGGALQGVNIQLTHAPPPLKVETKSTSQSGLSSFDYIFSGLIGFSLLGLGVFGPINMLPSEKKTGALTRLQVTPLKPSQFILAYMLSQLTAGVLSIGVMFLVAIKFFDFHMQGSFLTFVVFTTIAAIAIFGVGVAVGGWASDEKQAAPLGNMVSFPMMFLSGTFFPRFLMPEWLQAASAFLPLTPAVDGIRYIITEGKTLMELGPQLGLLGIWIVVIYTVAFRVFRWD